LFTAVTVIVVELPAVAGAVSLTVMSWLIESDVPELGTGLGNTLTIVHAPFELAADNVNDAANAEESLYVSR